MEFRKVTINSIAREVYKVDGIVLSSKENTRRIFYPLVTAKGIDGNLLYERKNHDGTWTSEKGLKLSNLKTGQWTSMHLSVDELMTLFQYLLEVFDKVSLDSVQLKNYYILFGSYGNYNAEEIEKINKLLTTSPNLLKQLNQLNDSNPDISIEAILKFLNSSDGLNSFISQHEKIDKKVLDAFDRMSKLNALDTAELEQLINNDSDEESFQNYFDNHRELLSIVFPSIVNVIHSKPYLGGKRSSDDGGIYSDFLAAEASNTVFIEIKRPSCRLLSNAPYRDEQPGISNEIINAVIQVQIERDTYYKEMCGKEKDYSFYNGKCYVIAGMSSTITTENGRRVFELFKNNLNNIQIVTYDELLGSIQRIKSIFIKNE